MQFFKTLAAFGFISLVSAQSSTVNSTSIISSTTSSSSAPASTSNTAEQKCLKACGIADICCQAACVNVPCPSQSQANQTTECAARCDQGNGTSADTQAYASCQASCVSSLFFSTTAGGAAATGSNTAGGSAASATQTGIGGAASSGSGSATTGASGSGSETASATSSSASSTDNAASNIKTQIAGAGLLGLVLAGLAV